jgi:hypothetical protein
MPKSNNGYIEFSTEESKSAHCPVCGYDNLKRRAIEVTPRGIFYPWHCGACGAMGDEFVSEVFAGHRVSYVPDKYIIPGFSCTENIPLWESH